MRPTFKDPNLQRQFEQDNFVELPFLEDPAELDSLRMFFDSIDTGEINTPLFSCMDQGNTPVEVLTREFAQIGARAIEKHFVDYKLISGNFLIKKPDSNGLVVPHQDWEIVDESRMAGVGVWVPLVDVDFDSGVLGIMKGSLGFYPWVRCSPAKESRKKAPYASYARDLTPYLDYRTVKAGSAIVFHPGAIHGSLPNRSSIIRTTAVFSLIPADAELVHHYIVPGSELSRYETFSITPEFFVNYPNCKMIELYESGSRPDLPSLGSFPYNVSSVPQEELIAKAVAAGNSQHRSLLL